MLDPVLLIAGFFLLIYGANLLVDGASSLALRFRVPNIVIGLTIVAFGTSAPELAVNILGSVRGSSGIVMGNVLGSNIFNVMIILGISALFFPLGVKTRTTWIEIPLAILAAVIVFIMSTDVFLDQGPDNVIQRSEGLVLLGFFLIFVVYTATLMKGKTYEEGIPQRQLPAMKTLFYIVLGLLMLSFGGRMIVDSASELARALGLSERVISLTIVSVGTSLPELATSIVAARKRNVDMAIGNIVGSNIFNTFLILGISSAISPVMLTKGVMLDLEMNLAAVVLLFIFVFTGRGRRIEKWEGLIFILIYLGYLAYLLMH